MCVAVALYLAAALKFAVAAPLDLLVTSFVLVATVIVAIVTITVATSTNDVTSRSSGAATANFNAAARYSATATHIRPTYTDRSRACGVGIADPVERPPNHFTSRSLE